MDSNRFDALARAAASAPSRRSLIAATLSGIATIALGRSADAAKKRLAGEVCREHSNCTSNFCGPKDSRGRRVCVCATGADCPAPQAPCAAAICNAGVCGQGPKPKDTICHTPSNICDPPGYCTGSSTDCPHDPHGYDNKYYCADGILVKVEGPANPCAIACRKGVCDDPWRRCSPPPPPG